MKKVCAAILALLYFTTSVGATVHFHYCMDRMVGWSLNKASSVNCSACGMKKSISQDSGCCKDDVKVIKNTADQKTNSASLHFTSPEPAIVNGVAIPEYNLVHSPHARPLANGPPLLHPEGIYLLYRCFRI